MNTVQKKIVRKMIWLRIAQMLINEEYKAGKFKIPVHLALGHEAIVVAIDAQISKKDRLVLSHRNIAYNLVRANSFKKILNEYLLKKNGLAKGRLGSMNLANPEREIPYASSILGNNFSVATGIALAQKTKKTKGVTFVLGGDGSMEEGSFYESLVFAKSLALPIVFIIENNEWSLATHITHRRGEINLALMARSIGVSFISLSGNNPDQYTRALSEAKKHAAKDCPVLLEVSVSTLGDWTRPDGTPAGHFVNYHSGPAPTISHDKKRSVIVKRSTQDPVYVLLQKYGESLVDRVAKTEYERIKKESR